MRKSAGMLPRPIHPPPVRRLASIAGLHSGVLCALAVGIACNAPARQTTAAAAAGPAQDVRCLPGGEGYLRARLSGAVRAELAWGNEGTECSGALRVTDGGIRMRFKRSEGPQQGTLVLVFGIAGLKEGASGRNLPVNVTVIREGQGEFYSTQGDDKCSLDQVSQQPLVGIPHRSRSYRVVARGFCTEPARAVHGKGAILLSRFDYAGRVDFEPADQQDDAELTATDGQP